ncbi:MAG: ABC transporter ATP-binding protein [Candidatus Pacebacteria bacterium]|nr:ABC transporter ATP-binding protein [Candidatus Paceibacterota bacterium]
MIQLQHVTKQFGQAVAVEDFSLKIGEGEIIGFLGPNGAGKTTTIRMMAGVLPPSKGKVIIDGKQLIQKSQSIKTKIGYLPENNPLYEELTVEEYLKFWLKVKGIFPAEQKKALSFVIKGTGLGPVYYRLIGELSKGFRQRVGLAQAILSRPQILLLDEPTEGLDPNQRREMHALIKELGKRKTVIICSHVLSEVTRMCNRLVIIHRGKLVADGSPDSLSKAASGQQIIEVELTGNKILSQIKGLSGVDEVVEDKARGENGQYLVVKSADKKDLRPAIFSLVKKNRWQLWTLVKKQIEIEDIFAQLTTS